MRRAAFAVLCAGVLFLTGCARQETSPALQEGYFDTSGLTVGEPLTQDFAPNFELADENAAPPTEVLTCCTNADGAQFLFDKAGRLRSYTANTGSPSASVESLKTEDALHAVCDEVLASYIEDYAKFTEITSQYYEGDGTTYNLAMEHVIAEGIADYALIRLDTQGQVYDLSVSYADADGDAEQNFVTDGDRAYFAEQIQPYVNALADYAGEVTYLHYKRLDGRLYAFCEISYTDTGTGLTAGQKLLLFVKD